MKTIVTAGKGGTGKSVLLANLLSTHILPQVNRTALIVDADPHQSLTRLLSEKYHLPSTASLGNLKNVHINELRSGSGLQGPRNQLADELIRQAVVTLPIAGVSLLTMGRNEQPGCQCIVNTLLGNALETLQDRFDLVFIDNEAGIEPIGRHHKQRVDILLLLTTLQALDLDVAENILAHAATVGRQIDHSILVINKMRPTKNRSQISLPRTDEISLVPYSQEVEENDGTGLDFNAALWNLSNHIKPHLLEN